MQIWLLDKHEQTRAAGTLPTVPPTPLQLQANLRKTIVFITHDLDEALRLGSRIAILKDGQLVQVGEPTEILEHPANDYVRRFVEKRSARVPA